MVNKIILHCSNSDWPEHDAHALHFLYNWHVIERSFIDIGYHYIISKTKGLELGRPIAKAGAHVRGHNNYSIGIVLCGKDHFSLYQKEVLIKLLVNLTDIFRLSPSDVVGHCEIDPRKTCPNFDVSEYRKILES